MFIGVVSYCVVSLIITMGKIIFLVPQVLKKKTEKLAIGINFFEKRNFVPHISVWLQFDLIPPLTFFFGKKKW